MSLDHYVTLGLSLLSVIPFGLGESTFGEDLCFWASVTDSEAMFSHYCARGGNFIDTANAYTKGHSEKIIGDSIRQGATRRDQLVIPRTFRSPRA